MYKSKQQAINYYLDIITHDTTQTFNEVEDLVWVNANKMMVVLNEHALLKETLAVKLPPAIEADWDTNDTKEFDHLLYKILFSERTLH